MDGQRLALMEESRNRGYETPVEFSDKVSGAKFTRQGLDAMMQAVRAGQIKVILAYKLDRLGRSLSHLAQLITELDKAGCALIVPGQGIDTSVQNPAGRLVMGILMAIAEFERSLIRERTKAGLIAAKARGRIIGRPKIHADLKNRAEAIFERNRAHAMSLPTCRMLGQELGVSTGLAFLVRKELLNGKTQAS